MAEFLNKFKAWIIAGVGLLLYWLGRKDEKIKQIDTKQKGQLNAIHQANVARNTRLSLSGLSGCTTNIADLEFCQIYEPIFADYDHDTQETIDQIDRNNLVYDDLCT